MPDRDAPIAPTVDGFELPVTGVLTGRGAVFGKSGSGKSNTVTVILEELLERDLGCLVVDSDGEYFGLKESYEVVRAGDTDDCDVRVGPGDAEALARLALDESVPVVLDLSGYLDADVVDALVEETLKHLFHLENERKQPFLVVLEEAHEYVPQSGRSDDLAETVIRVAKRGRKRGLGMLAVSQRPAAVDKDFITQCNWLVWHRLTWNNDVEVVRKHLDASYANRIESLDAGEAFVVGDWADGVHEVRFRRKETYDAGATPGFESTDPPELRPLPPGLLDGIGGDADPERSGAGTDPGSDTDAGTDTVTPETDDSGATTRTGGTRDADAGDTGRSGSRTTSERDDIVWEAGQLVTYLIRVGYRGFRTALRRLSATTARTTRRVGTATAAGLRSDDDRRVSTDPQVVVLLLLVVLAIVVGVWLV
ncbi:ATP-binding protein [Halobaculum magnesiiphilum]|uniref:DUF87 domain-containing protein n=1 Tax=Halobaculum magnesiiphilum TaxID=1017351 RepID=A0A8T8WAW9_9EURY|nr:DUF87 domain-containing protein [Halobaculum magnesiiphilum]QZP37012.1 DUF87 domain-containing protein [Halobaculum magnesiiphilum]